MFSEFEFSTVQRLRRLIVYWTWNTQHKRWHLFRNLRNKRSHKVPGWITRWFLTMKYWQSVSDWYISVNTTTGIETICIVVEIVNVQHWLINDLLVMHEMMRWIIHLKCLNYQIVIVLFKNTYGTAVFFSEEKQFVWKIRALFIQYAWGRNVCIKSLEKE